MPRTSEGSSYSKISGKTGAKRLFRLANTRRKRQVYGRKINEIHLTVPTILSVPFTDPRRTNHWIGWSHQENIAQLSLWTKDSSKMEPQSRHPDHWESKIEEFVDKKQLFPRTMYNHQCYRTVADLYDAEGHHDELRKGEGPPNVVKNYATLHFLVEQSCLQWALEEGKVDPQLSNLAVLVLKMLWQAAKNEVMALPRPCRIYSFKKVKKMNRKAWPSES